MKYLIILLMLPFVAASEMAIDIDISRSGLVTEDITIIPDSGYDAITYDAGRPVSVIFDGDYSIDNTILEFPYNPELRFSLIYDDLIMGQNHKVFRTSFIPGVDKYTVSVILPKQHILDGEPSAIPRPDSISTDGQRIMLSWEFSEVSDISVFYKGPANMLWPWFLAILIILAVAVFASRYIIKQKIEQMLTPDESLVIAEMQKETRQDKIAKTIGFSKSKMSKVVRKLEEKGVVKKTPYFKTNILKR